MKNNSLFQSGKYSTGWIKDFYTQAGIWWGDDPHGGAEAYAQRVATVERLCGAGRKRILDLGAGSGYTAAALADAGHSVVGVELNPTVIEYARKLLDIDRPGSLVMLEDDFYTVKLDGRFDIVCWWEGFGLGTDDDQRRMLKRIASEWLSQDGCALIDIYNPVRAARHAGEEIHLDALEGVPGSVAMKERCHFDPIYSRWIDEWQPVNHPELALAQTIRCYSPLDFCLLLEGTGLAISKMEIDGAEIDYKSNSITLDKALLDAWGYLVRLRIKE